MREGNCQAYQSLSLCSTILFSSGRVWIDWHCRVSSDIGSSNVDVCRRTVFVYEGIRDLVLTMARMIPPHPPPPPRPIRISWHDACGGVFYPISFRSSSLQCNWLQGFDVVRKIVVSTIDNSRTRGDGLMEPLRTKSLFLV